MCFLFILVLFKQSIKSFSSEVRVCETIVQSQYDNDTTTTTTTNSDTATTTNHEHNDTATTATTTTSHNNNYCSYYSYCY